MRARAGAQRRDRVRRDDLASAGSTLGASSRRSDDSPAARRARLREPDGGPTIPPCVGSSPASSRSSPWSASCCPPRSSSTPMRAGTRRTRTDLHTSCMRRSTTTRVATRTAARGATRTTTGTRTSVPSTTKPRNTTFTARRPTARSADSGVVRSGSTPRPAGWSRSRPRSGSRRTSCPPRRIARRRATNATPADTIRARSTAWSCSVVS